MTSNGFNPINVKRNRILDPNDRVEPIDNKKRKPTPDNEKLSPIDVAQRLRTPLPSLKTTAISLNSPNNEAGHTEIDHIRGSSENEKPSATTLVPDRRTLVPRLKTTTIRPKLSDDEVSQEDIRQNEQSRDILKPYGVTTPDAKKLFPPSRTSTASSRNPDHEFKGFKKRKHSPEVETPLYDTTTQDIKALAPSVEANATTAFDLQFVNFFGTAKRSDEGRKAVRQRARQHAWDERKAEEAAAGISKPPKTRKPSKKKSSPRMNKLENLAPAVDSRQPTAATTTLKYSGRRKMLQKTCDINVPPEYLTAGEQIGTPSSFVRTASTPSSLTSSIPTPTSPYTTSSVYTASSPHTPSSSYATSSSYIPSLPYTSSPFWVVKAASESSSVRLPTTNEDESVDTSHQALLNELPEDVVRYVKIAIASFEHQMFHPMRIKSVHADPFNSYGIQLSPRMHHLMHYSRGVSNIHFETEDGEDLFHMSQSPALVYATLAWVTAVAVSSSDNRQDSFFLLNRSVKAINEDLNAAKNGGSLSDGTIAAVACIMNLSAINGDQNSASVHMSGLEDMISSRGGLQAVGKNRHVRRLILWADVMSATLWETTPRFQLKDVPGIRRSEDLDRYIPAGSPEKDKTFTIPPILANIYRDTNNMAIMPVQFYLYNLAEFLDVVPAKDPGLLDRSCYSDHVHVVEHKILQFLRGGTLDRHPILLPLVHSFLLWLYTNIRLTPRAGLIRRILVDRLKTYIMRLKLSDVNHSNPNELRWMLFLGGASACGGTPQRFWFVEHMSDIGPAAWWDCWTNISWLLKGFERAFLEECHTFWCEVEERNRMKSDTGT